MTARPESSKAVQHAMHEALAFLLFCLLLATFLPSAAFAQLDTSRGDKMIADYFRRETAKLTRQSLAEIQTREDWEKHRGRISPATAGNAGPRSLPRKDAVKAGRHRDFGSG